MGVTLADTAEAVLRNVEDTNDAAAVKKFLEFDADPEHRGDQVHGRHHIGAGASTVSVVEYKNGHWTKADPIK